MTLLGLLPIFPSWRYLQSSPTSFSNRIRRYAGLANKAGSHEPQRFPLPCHNIFFVFWQPLATTRQSAMPQHLSLPAFLKFLNDKFRIVIFINHAALREISYLWKFLKFIKDQWSELSDFKPLYIIQKSLHHFTHSGHRDKLFGLV